MNHLLLLLLLCERIRTAWVRVFSFCCNGDLLVFLYFYCRFIAFFLYFNGGLITLLLNFNGRNVTDFLNYRLLSNITTHLFCRYDFLFLNLNSRFLYHLLYYLRRFLLLLLNVTSISTRLLSCDFGHFINDYHYNLLNRTLNICHGLKQAGLSTCLRICDTSALNHSLK